MPARPRHKRHENLNVAGNVNSSDGKRTSIMRWQMHVGHHHGPCIRVIELHRKSRNRWSYIACSHMHLEKQIQCFAFIEISAVITESGKPANTHIYFLISPKSELMALSPFCDLILVAGLFYDTSIALT